MKVFNKILMIICILYLSQFYVYCETNKRKSFSNNISIDSNFIYINNEKFIIKGISYNPYYPGERNGDDMKIADFNSDLDKISRANINTILLYWLRPFSVYMTCKEFDLKIVQGIVVPETDDYGNKRFRERVKRSIAYCVDYINNNGFSSTIMAYFIGGEFDPYSIKASNLKNKKMEKYESKHFSSKRKLNSVEDFLLEMADYLRDYEMKTYKTSHIVSHIHWPFAEQDMLIEFMDIAMFDVYCFWPSWIETFKKGSYTKTSYQGYIEYLKKKYNNIPLFISEFGYSTAPEEDEISVDEETQAVELLNRWVDIMTSEYPLAGGSVFEWNDEWWKQAKSAEFTGIKKDPFHHDKDDSEEWFGIISIDGPSSDDYKVRSKIAYSYVKNMFNPKFNAHKFFKKSIKK